jgi:hypothetical protein
MRSCPQSHSWSLYVGAATGVELARPPRRPESRRAVFFGLAFGLRRGQRTGGRTPASAPARASASTSASTFPVPTSASPVPASAFVFVSVSVPVPGPTSVCACGLGFFRPQNERVSTGGLSCLLRRARAWRSRWRGPGGSDRHHSAPAVAKGTYAAHFGQRSRPPACAVLSRHGLLAHFILFYYIYSIFFSLSIARGRLGLVKGQSHYWAHSVASGTVRQGPKRSN